MTLKPKKRTWSRKFLDLAGSAPDFPYPDEPPPAEPGPELKTSQTREENPCEGSEQRGIRG